jgi:hypothetical protein
MYGVQSPILSSAPENLNQATTNQQSLPLYALAIVSNTAEHFLTAKWTASTEFDASK